MAKRWGLPHSMGNSILSWAGACSVDRFERSHELGQAKRNFQRVVEQPLRSPCGFLLEAACDSAKKFGAEYGEYCRNVVAGGRVRGGGISRNESISEPQEDFFECFSAKQNHILRVAYRARLFVVYRKIKIACSENCQQRGFQVQPSLHRLASATGYNVDFDCLHAAQFEGFTRLIDSRGRRSSCSLPSRADIDYS